MTKYIDKLNNHLSRGSEEQYNEMKLECSLHKYTNIFLVYWNRIIKAQQTAAAVMSLDTTCTQRSFCMHKIICTYINQNTCN